MDLSTIVVALGIWTAVSIPAGIAAGTLMARATEGAADIGDVEIAFDDEPIEIELPRAA